MGTATYGAQEGIHLGHRNLRCPSRLELKSKLGAQAEIHLGHRNLRCPRSAWSWGKIQNFIHELSEIGNAKKNVFCTVLLPKFDLTYLQQTLFLIISTIG